MQGTRADEGRPGSAAPTRTGDPAAGTADRARSPRIEARRAATRQEIIDAAWELAHEVGPTGFTLRELAARVGMRASSLYEYFDSKSGIYDEMFAQGSRAFLDAMAAIPPLHEIGRREALLAAARAFLGFATADPVRFQLLFQHAITGWAPSPEAYAPAVATFELASRRLAEVGATSPRSVDLWTALVTGLASQQVANDPAGRRWHDLVDDVVDLYLDHLDREDR